MGKNLTKEKHAPTSPMAASVNENGLDNWCEKSSKPELVPGLELNGQLTTDIMHEKVKELLKDSPPLLQRDFQTVVSSNGHGDNEDSNNVIRIMQWNILADALSIGKDNFVRCPVEALQWPKRRLNILQEILAVNPDVLTMQEVDHFGFFQHLLSVCGYLGYFFPKPDSPTLYVKNNNGPDGCAIFYRTDKLEIISENRVVLKTMSAKNDTNQVSIIVTLRIKNSCKTFCVATTHLKAKTGWEDLRFDQGQYLAALLEEQCKDQALILCGDFNAEQSEKVYSVFTNSKLKLASTYKKANVNDSEPAYTTWKIRGSSDGKTEKESKRTIDYVWYTPKFLTLESVLELPSPEQIGENRLPSHSYPSDHLSLAADFRLQ